MKNYNVFHGFWHSVIPIQFPDLGNCTTILSEKFNTSRIFIFMGKLGVRALESLHGNPELVPPLKTFACQIAPEAEI